MDIQSGQSAPFSAKTRQHNLTRLSQEVFDLLIIGGGITGAAIANEAAQRSYSVALVEQGDFASGSSSKSSKLIHGGLRYLSSLKLGLVFELCRQRQRLLGLAPHLIRPVPFLLPFYPDSPHPRWQLRLAMWLYDMLASLGASQGYVSDQPWPRHRIWPAQQLLARLPWLNSLDISGAACYYDCVADDTRLTLITLINAHHHGAVLTNYTKVVGLLQTRGRVVGVQLCDEPGGIEIEGRARLVIGAAGPWTDKLLKLTEQPTQPWLQPTKGVHVVIRRERLPIQTALAFNAPQDGRFMFALPWNNRVIIGTTDTPFEGDLDNVCATSADVAYILQSVDQALPSLNLTERDILSTYAGVRPLLGDGVSGSNDQRSRGYRLRQVVPGLLTMAGGKLTLHRLMAREAIDHAARILAGEQGKPWPAPNHNCRAALPGGESGDWADLRPHRQSILSATDQLPNDVSQHLMTTYGAEMYHLLAILTEQPFLARRICPGLPNIQAEVIHAIRYEMALNLTDVLERRARILTCATDQGLGAAQTVAKLMAAELNWTPQQQAMQLARYRYEVAKSRFWQDGL